MPSSCLSVVISIFRNLSPCPRDVTANSDLLGRESESSTNAYSSSSDPSNKDIGWQTGQSKSFADLPPELVIQIFKGLDSLSTAWALCKTSRQLDFIFTLNADAILRNVAFRSPEAHQLASAQELAASREHSLPTHPTTALNRNHRMLSSASAALRALRHYETSIYKHSEQEGHEHLPRRQLTPAEQISFLLAYYRALALVTSGGPRIPFSSLARLDMLSYLQMREVTMLLTPVRKWQDRTDLGINFPHICSAPNGCKSGFKAPFAPVTLPIEEDTFTIPTVNWEETLLSLSCIEERLLLNSACHRFHCEEPRSFCYFLLFDGYQKEVGSAKGPKLGGLIRDLCKNGILNYIVDFADGLYDSA